MHGDSTAKSKQTQLESSGFNESRGRLINNSQVVDLVLARPELLHDADVLDQSPDSKDWDGESDGTREEKGKLGEGKVDREVAELVDDRLTASLLRDLQQLVACGRRDQRRVLEKVAKYPGLVSNASSKDSLVAHALQ